MPKPKATPLPNPRPRTDPNFKEKVRRHQAMLKSYQARNKVDIARTKLIEVNAMLAELGATDTNAIDAVRPALAALEHLYRELSLVIMARQNAFEEVREPDDVIR